VDGINDLGGRQGFGPVVVETGKQSPPARWEAASFVLFGEVLVPHLANVSPGAHRHAVERMDPKDYLNASYYERWLTAAATLAVESGIVTRAELEERAGGPYPLSRPGTAETITDPPVGRSRFSVGDRVRVRQWHPPGHTRCPGYVRGHVGVVTRCDGWFSIPDVEAHSVHRASEATYSVRFDADELWNDGQPSVTVNVDLWDNYLEPA
jgi:nitrile hydratase subunit beta